MVDFDKLLKRDFPENYCCEENKRDNCQKEVIDGCESCKHFVEKEAKEI